MALKSIDWQPRMARAKQPNAGNSFDVTPGGIITNLASEILVRIYDKNVERLKGTRVEKWFKQIGLIEETFNDVLLHCVANALENFYTNNPSYSIKMREFFISPTVTYCIKEYLFSGKTLNDTEIEKRFTELLSAEPELQYTNTKEIYDKFQTELIIVLSSEQTPGEFLIRNDLVEVLAGQKDLKKDLQEILQILRSPTYEYRVSGGNSAIHATHPDDLTDKPDILFGREQLMTDVRALLENHDRVLLQGFGGMGKTALAATIAANWIKDDKGSVLWLKAGSVETHALFEAIARPFNAQQAIDSQTGDAKTKVVRDLLRGCGATLLVLDDCWNNKALFTLLKAVPSDMALLITARQRYPISKIQSVDELAPTNALALLAHHADRDLNIDPQAIVLCDLLGNHAFAIEIAGKALKSHNWRSAELIKNINDAPDKLTMPLELSESGRENVAKLLEISLNSLDKETRNVFFAFGAFFAPQLTPEMLMRYFIGTPEVTDEILAEIRATNPQLPADMPDDELRLQIQDYIVNIDDINPARVVRALDTLHLHGLAGRISSTYTTVTVYRIHDLAYSYARAQNVDSLRRRALQACLGYLARYRVPSLDNSAALQPELNNLLGAVNWAFENGNYVEVMYIGGNLNEFMDNAGFYSDLLHLLIQAEDAANRMGRKRYQAAHLNHMGTTYQVLGQGEKGIACLTQALTISQEMGDRLVVGNILGNLGTAYRELGQLEKAISYLEQALSLSRELEDRLGEGNRLGNLGIAYSYLGQVDKAIEYHEQALIIRREINDPRGEGTDLGNLGNAYLELGQLEKAKSYYEQALTLSREIGDKLNEGSWLSNIGNIFTELGQPDKAISYLEQALMMRREIKDLSGEGHDLNNLGHTYNILGQSDKAISYLEQALTISHQIGNRLGESKSLGNLGVAFSHLGQVEKGISYLEQALTISRQIGNRRDEGHNLGNLGNSYSVLGKLDTAVDHYEQALAIAREIGDRLTQGNILTNLGTIYVALRQVEKGLRVYLEVRTMFIDIGAQHLVAEVDKLIAQAQSKM